MDATSRIREVFAQAVELPPGERGKFLADACAGAGPLRAAVESLLLAHDRAGQFMGDPSIDPARFSAGELYAPGMTIGPYTLVKTLGEGGYGAVFLAEQELPVRRQVALKLIKPGMDSRQIIARFKAESQILALMDHSSIARIFDAGTTPAGHPYFVMEYVDGRPITTFCRSLPLRERLTLFHRVCMAVQHAHQKGVIHRDLKPANILVAMQDGAPVPKIIDFGIAKALQEEPGSRTFSTLRGQFIGTPQYMSPEQAGAAPDLDTRADIYSLGAILYEILTGTSAFDPATLHAAAAAEMERIIREVDPPLPSTRLRMISQSSPAAAPGDSRTARRTAQLLKGDLDWIVVRSMEKDRERRYETAESLANDIQHYLASEPVSAGPPGRMYRFSKLVMRNRALMASAAAVFLALAIGLAISFMALARANHQRDLADKARLAEAAARDEAVANEAKAKAQSAKLLEVQTFLFRLLAPSKGPNGPELPPLEFLDYASRKIADPSFTDHPEAQSPVYLALGSAYRQHGLYAQAETRYRSAIDCLHKSGDGDDPNLASAMNNLADALMNQKKFDEAEPLLTDSLAMYRRLNHEDNLVDAPVLLNQAQVYASKGQLDKALSLAEAALDCMRKGYHNSGPIVAEYLDSVADILEQMNRPEEASKRRAEAQQLGQVEK